MERIVFMDRKLRKSETLTIKLAAEHFEVSERQIKRDIEYMKDRFSAPVTWNKEFHSYRYSKPFTDLEFADQTMIISHIMLRSLVKNGHYMPIMSKKLLETLNSEVPRDFSSVCEKIRYQLPQATTINPDYFMDICTSLEKKLCISIKYCNLRGETSERLIEPEQLINYSGSWYMLCWDHRRKNLRTFHLSRITELQLSDSKFSSPEEKNKGTGFATYEEYLDSFIGAGFGIFEGVPIATVKIRFYGEVRGIVSSQIWHPKQSVTEGIDSYGPEYTELEFPVSNFTEVLGKILSYGSNARPIQPLELCELWKTEIKKMSRLSKI